MIRDFTIAKFLSSLVARTSKMRSPRPNPHPTRICFVTGTRAEFGLMESVLKAIRKNKKLKLQIVATGMHLDPRHGESIERFADAGWDVDAVVPWRGKSLAEATGLAVAGLARAFKKLRPDVVILVGDRVEGLAAATAAHLNGIAVAHVHGGDRALGQVDDALRHAITKLSHIHFPATKESARRILKLGENRWRIHTVGSPGIDGIRKSAAPSRKMAAEFGDLARGQFALLALHPADADQGIEFERAQMVLQSVLAANIPRVVVIYPNNDPGSAGIIRCWENFSGDPRLIIRRDVDRRLFLGLLRDSAFLIGNSSAGIIEAASFGTPVIDVGPRQLGRQRCQDVQSVPYRQAAIATAVKKVWNTGRPLRSLSPNVYEGQNTGVKIAEILRKLMIDEKLLHKLISY